MKFCVQDTEETQNVIDKSRVSPYSCVNMHVWWPQLRVLVLTRQGILKGGSAKQTPCPPNKAQCTKAGTPRTVVYF